MEVFHRHESSPGAAPAEPAAKEGHAQSSWVGNLIGVAPDRSAFRPTYVVEGADWRTTRGRLSEDQVMDVVANALETFTPEMYKTAMSDLGNAPLINPPQH